MIRVRLMQICMTLAAVVGVSWIFTGPGVSYPSGKHERTSAKGELNQIQGCWVLKKLECYDCFPPKEFFPVGINSQSVTVQGTLFITDKSKSVDSQFEILPYFDGKAEVLEFIHGEERERYSALYEVRGNSWLLCFDKGGTVPSDFSSKKGRCLLIYERKQE